MSLPDSPFARRRTRPIVAVLLMLAGLPVLFWAMRGVRMENDVDTWLPDDDVAARVLNWYRDEFEPNDRILVSWDDSSLLDPRVTLFADALRDDPEASRYFSDVTIPQKVLAEMMDGGSGQTDSIRNLGGVLLGRADVGVRMIDGQQDTADELAHSIVAYAEKTWQIKLDIVQPDPGLFSENDELEAALDPAEDALEKWEPAPFHFALHGDDLWAHKGHTADLIKYIQGLDPDKEQIEEVFLSNAYPAAVAITLSDEGIKHRVPSIEAVERIASEVDLPRETFRLAGGAVVATRLNTETNRAFFNTDGSFWKIWNRSPVLLSAIVGGLLACVLLRSLLLASLVLLTSIYTAAVVVALIPLTGNSLNMVLIVMPNLLMVLTMSGTVHLANYWKHGVAASDPRPVFTAVKMAAEPCLLASATTAIGMFSLVTSELEPVRQFGIFAAVGCLLSLVTTLWLFPALLIFFPNFKVTQPEQNDDKWRQLGHWLYRHGRLVALLSLTAFVLGVVGLKWFRTETKAIRYFDAKTQVVKDYDYLESNLSGIVTVDVLIHFEQEDIPTLGFFDRMEIVHRVEEKLRAIPGVTGTLSLADFRDMNKLPSAFGPRRRMGVLAERRVFEDRHESTKQFIVHASKPLSVSDGATTLDVKAGDEVWRVRAQSSVMADISYAELLLDVDAAVTEETQEYPIVHHAETGMVPSFNRTQQAVLESLIVSFGLAFLVIAIVMMIVLRSIPAGLLAMLPNLLPVAVVFGGISFIGIPVDIGTMITASVALGIAVDGTLHLLTWFRHGIRAGLSREESIAQGLSHCAPAMWQTSATIAVGMAMLGFSDLLLISRFGWLMAALVATALFADIIYLPSLLSGTLGSIISRGLSPKEIPTTTATPAEAVTANSP